MGSGRLEWLVKGGQRAQQGGPRGTVPESLPSPGRRPLAKVVLKSLKIVMFPLAHFLCPCTGKRRGCYIRQAPTERSARLSNTKTTKKKVCTGEYIFPNIK